MAPSTSGFVLSSDTAGVMSWVANGGGWSLRGNAVNSANYYYSPNNDFIGTTNNMPLIFKVAGQGAGVIDSAAFNTFFGYQAVSLGAGGNNNTANGYRALYNNAGSNNTAVGSNALLTVTFGSYNTAIGYGADVLSNGFLTNATAIGANAKVGSSNALVLGSVASGVPGAPTGTNVGIGTVGPGYTLQIGETAHPATFAFIDGNQAAGKVLTGSDAYGNAKWQKPAVVGYSSGELLKILRGRIQCNSTACTVLSGGGFTVSRTAIGAANISISSPFSTVPVVTVSMESVNGMIRVNPYTTALNIYQVNTSGVSVDSTFDFIAVGNP